MQVKKGFKRVTVALLSAVMIMGSTMTVLADTTNGEDATTAGTGNVLDFKIQRQVVPTAIKVAINPKEFPVDIRYSKVATGTDFVENTKYYSIDSESGKYVVETGVTAENIATKITAGLYTAETSTAQIVTLNYGLANESTVARKVAIDFTVAADSEIEFVDTAAKATAEVTADDGGAKRGEYKMFLQIIPAKVGTAVTANTYQKSAGYVAATTEYFAWNDTQKVYVGPQTFENEAAYKAVQDQLYTATTTIGIEIKASELADVGMTNSTAGITFEAGTTEGTATASIGYSLPKATYSLKDDAYIDFSTTQAQVKDKYEMSGIGGLGAFTITGTMNTNTEWSELTTKTVTITPVYTITDATGEETAVETGLNQIALAPVVAATPASMSTTAKSAAISGIGEGVTLSSVKVVKVDNAEVTLTATTQYTYTNNTFAIVNGKEVLLDNTKYSKFILTYSDGTVVNIPIVAAE